MIELAPPPPAEVLDAQLAYREEKKRWLYMEELRRKTLGLNQEQDYLFKRRLAEYAKNSDPFVFGPSVGLPHYIGVYPGAPTRRIPHSPEGCEICEKTLKLNGMDPEPIPVTNYPVGYFISGSMGTSVVDPSKQCPACGVGFPKENTLKQSTYELEDLCDGMDVFVDGLHKMLKDLGPHQDLLTFRRQLETLLNDERVNAFRSRYIASGDKG